MRPIPDALPPHRHRTGSSDDAGARMGVVAYEFRRAGAALFRDARVPGGGTTRRRSTAPPWPGHRAAASARGNGRKGARAGLWPIDTSRPAGGPFPPPRGPVRPAGTVRVSGTYELERKPWWSGGGSVGRADTDWTLDLGRGRLGSAKAEQIVANLRVGVSESDEG